MWARAEQGRETPVRGSGTAHVNWDHREAADRRGGLCGADQFLPTGGCTGQTGRKTPRTVGEGGWRGPGWMAHTETSLSPPRQCCGPMG